MYTIKKKKIFCIWINKEDLNQQFADKLYGIPLHGIAHVRGTSEIYNIAINIVKEGFVAGVQNENAINLNIITDKYHLQGTFHYFKPFGVLLTKEVNELLSSPIIPQEIIDAIGSHKQQKTFGHQPVLRSEYHAPKIREEVETMKREGTFDEEKYGWNSAKYIAETPRILNPEVISLLKKHGFGKEFDGRWAHALTNANIFRTYFNENTRGKPPSQRQAHENVDLDREYGFRGWYVDNHKKIRSLKVTPEMIERILIVDLGQDLGYESGQLFQRLYKEKLLKSL